MKPARRFLDDRNVSMTETARVEGPLAVSADGLESSAEFVRAWDHYRRAVGSDASGLTSGVLDHRELVITVQGRSVGRVLQQWMEAGNPHSHRMIAVYEQEASVSPELHRAWRAMAGHLSSATESGTIGDKSFQVRTARPSGNPVRRVAQQVQSVVGDVQRRMAAAGASQGRRLR